MLESLVRHSHNHASEHVEETTVRVVREACAALLAETLHDLVIQAEVEHGVHHTGHGNGRAGTHREKQRVLDIPELGTERLFNVRETFEDVLPHASGQLLVVVVVALAGFRGDGHSRRNRETDLAHLSEVGTLTAKEHLHALVSIGASLGEKVNVFLFRQSGSVNHFSLRGSCEVATGSCRRTGPAQLTHLEASLREGRLL
mmetsp:Transcript_26656/g.44672  ORF Transcript_26656/g.44672 Transcript_26656/m.44672 type:complete len:201 (+) Transcript_26656:2492-3094(+)